MRVIPPLPVFARSLVAATTLVISLGLVSCATSEALHITEIETPRGALKTECSIPLVFSERHGLIAFVCDDGSIPIVHFNTPDRSISEAFVLNVAAIEDSDAGLRARAFRSAGLDGSPASLRSIDLLTGAMSVEKIAGAQDVDAIEISSTRDCLLVARSDRSRLTDYRITAHDMRGGRGVGDAINRAPDIEVDVTGNEASSIGWLELGFSRCLIGADGRPALLLTRIRPVDGVAEFTLELHTAHAAPKRLHQARGQWRLSSRQTGYRLALVDGETGRLGLIDLSGPSPLLTWVKFDGRWLHYDPSDGTGVVFRGSSGPDRHGAEARGPLVSVRCDPSAAEPVCHDDAVISLSAIEAYTSGVGGPGAGVIMRYTEVSVSPTSTRYSPRWRWLF